MSRYLKYADTTTTPGKQFEITDRPPHRAPIWLVGPEPEFAEYLTKDYKGASTVFLGGRFAVGQLWPNSITTVFFLFVPGFYYIAYVLPRYLNPVQDLGDGAVDRSVCPFAIFQHALAVIIMVSFILASLTNPGICPREESIPKEISRNMNQGQVNPRFLRISDITVKQKFCHSCFIYRPPRSKHCSFCDNCILRFDHHCTWLGNCVGLHNYPYFVTLIHSASIFLFQTCYVIISILSNAADGEYGDDAGFVDWLYLMFCENYKLVALFIYCLILLVAVLLLSVYHSAISVQNLTTNEHIKQYYRENPFDFGPQKNLCQIYCYPELVLADGNDIIEADFIPFGSYSDGLSFDDA